MGRLHIAQIDWKHFTGDAVIFPVCVRSPAMRGRNLVAQLKAMKERVSRVHMIVIDTLDRYNFDMDAGLCRSHADRWIIRNMPVVHEHLGDTAVRRWDEFREHAEFHRRLSAIADLYQGHDEIAGIVDHLAGYHISAHREIAAKRGHPFDVQKKKALSVAYLLEEFVGTSLYAEDYPGLPEVYWGSYVGDTECFTRHARGVSLTLPVTLPVTLNRLDPPIDGCADYRACRSAGPSAGSPRTRDPGKGTGVT